MTENGAAATLWRVRFAAPAEVAQRLLDAPVELALSVTVEEGAGAEPSHARIVELLLDRPPDPRLGEALAAVGIDGPPLDSAPLVAKDWLGEVARQARPVRVGRFVIHGSHARTAASEAPIAIEIDAGLAFGSGEHETTRGCLLALDRLPAALGARPRILDVGCGSGVLAIAAARRWPSARVLGVDNDPVAVAVAGANLALNGVATRCRAALSDGLGAAVVRRAAPFALILANVLADPLVAMAAPVARHLKPGGYVILAGLLVRQAADVLAAYSAVGLRLAAQEDLGEWRILTVTTTRPGRRWSRRARRQRAG